MKTRIAAVVLGISLLANIVSLGIVVTYNRTIKALQDQVSQEQSLRAAQNQRIEQILQQMRGKGG